MIAAGKFKRALVGNSVADIATNALIGILPTIGSAIPGTEIEIAIEVSTPEELITEVLG